VSVIVTIGPYFLTTSFCQSIISFQRLHLIFYCLTFTVSLPIPRCSTAFLHSYNNRLTDLFYKDPDDKKQTPIMEAALPPYAMIELYFGDRNAALTVMSSGKRFHITITTDDLRGEQGNTLLQKFITFKSNLDDPCAMEEFLDWMVKPCISYMDIFKPPTPLAEPPSLGEYFAPDTVGIKLTSAEGGLEATMFPDYISDMHSFMPRMALSDPTVLAAISHGAPLFPAAQLHPVLELAAPDADFDLLPTTVQATGSESLFHFKPAFEKPSFRRELDILLRLRSNAFSENLYVSRLAGLVLNNDGVSLLGLLVEHIRGSRTLHETVEGSGEEKCERWMRQLRATVKRLHRGGVVWGDVNPDNVLVDLRDNAWVVNFGGDAPRAGLTRS
jgi:hypothetical protein